MPGTTAIPDYYEILQISHNADMETIHRVYRMMASRFHPDNPESGNLEKFLELRRAYEVLSDPKKREHYDASQSGEPAPMPIFESKDFVVGLECERNRRLGVISLLYHRRRVSPEKPGVSMLELERRMALPREYLMFSLWYLKERKLVAMGDNSDYVVTVEGIDHLESSDWTSGIVKQLLSHAAQPADYSGHDAAYAAPSDLASETWPLSA